MSCGRAIQIPFAFSKRSGAAFTALYLVQSFALLALQPAAVPPERPSVGSTCA